MGAIQAGAVAETRRIHAGGGNGGLGGLGGDPNHPFGGDGSGSRNPWNQARRNTVTHTGGGNGGGNPAGGGHLGASCPTASDWHRRTSDLLGVTVRQ